MKYIYKTILLAAVYCSILANVAKAQAFPQADPAVITITKQGPSDPSPTGTNIVGTAILKFRVANNSAGNTANGKIPAGAVFYTVQFNPYYTYQSLIATSQFHVTYSSPGSPDYVVQLTNDVDINPGDVFDFYLNVIGLQPTTNPGGEIVTLNVDRTIPIQCGNTQTANDNVFKSFTVSAAAALPVKKIDLSALLRENNTIDLKWTTLDEINTSSFIVERSADGISFSAIGTKAASGATFGSTDYFFTDNDNQFLSGLDVVYYRIKMVDVGGEFAYSRTVLVKLSKKDSFLVWPNPFRDQLNIRITAEHRTDATINVYNSSGHLMIMQQQTIDPGINFITIRGANALPAGLYLIEMMTDSKKIALSKLIKQ